jgi:NAD(P)-dependent dehydrogenase (short-subunit alcohol dehydrogenase family)
MLEGRKALITGASSGLGRAMALAVAKAGAEVVITGRNVVALEESAMLIDELGGRCLALELEITDSDAVAYAVDRAWSEFGSLDVCFNNAGGNFYKSALETTDEEWDEVLRVNLTGAFYVARAVGRRMLAHGGGKLINVASDFGIRGAESWAAYSAAKGGLITLSKTLAWEWAPSVTVNVIAPGAFYTPMTQPMLDKPEIRQMVNQATPLGRVGEPDELGPVAVLLAGAGSDFMTGAVLNVDGGVIRA